MNKKLIIKLKKHHKRQVQTKIKKIKTEIVKKLLNLRFLLLINPQSIQKQNHQNQLAISR
jgi:hypothetical protein